MMLDQTAIVHGVFDIIEGTTPPSSGPHLATTLDTVLAALTLAALTLGAFGVVRAGRWVRRRRGAPVRAVLGLLPAVMVLGAGAAFPRLAEAVAWARRDLAGRGLHMAGPGRVRARGAARRGSHPGRPRLAVVAHRHSTPTASPHPEPSRDTAPGSSATNPAISPV